MATVGTNPRPWQGVGVLDGTTRSLEMVLGKLTVTEPTIGMTLEFSAGELPAATGGNMTVTAADCNSVSGVWSVEFPAASLGGQFTAFCLGAAVVVDQGEATRSSAATAVSLIGADR